MKIRNIFKQNFLPFSLGLLLASLIFTAINTYDTKMKLKQFNNIQKQNNNIQEQIKNIQEKQDRNHQEMMERKRD